MLQACRHRIRAIVARPASIAHPFSSSSILCTPLPNAPLELDPSMQALLKDVDISLRNYRHNVLQKRELEVLPMDENTITNVIFRDGEDELDELTRKSPAALFGSQQIGSVILPTELQSSINVLLAEADRPRLHEDAKRLFHSESSKGDEESWRTHYDVYYRTGEQAFRHADRDGTAFATVALPAHYSAIFSVFDHLKKRMGPEFEIERVLDWGAGTGSGFWAAGYSFQKDSTAEDATDIRHLEISNSTIESYTAIERRLGLIGIGKRLIKHVDAKANPIQSSWKKSMQSEELGEGFDGQKTIAMSAFMLTTLQTPLQRKKMLKEMWESGAHTLVVIDHNTKEGFEAVAEAREYFLKMGRKELETPELTTQLEVEDPELDTQSELENPALEPRSIRGSHVVAPCPHDGACPLYVPGAIRLVCGFSQRIQRPAFVRKTKHTGAGHEDIEYSYVVIRRGTRPARSETKVGRVGKVGHAEIAKEVRKRQPRELLLHDEHVARSPEAAQAVESIVATKEKPQSTEDLENALRQEAYSWPRLVFPPLKKSGHIILDGCTAEGQIVRMTIPKSQGKQPFYDARKSTWGDIFPHDAKKAPQVRMLSKKSKAPMEGYDIGKRKTTRASKQKRATYGEIATSIKEKRSGKVQERMDARNYSRKDKRD